MSAAEPLTMTLEEALRRLHEDDVWLEPSKAGDGWVVYRWNDVTDQIELHGDGATWPETVSAALGVRVVARDEAAELKEALREFFKAEAAVAALYHPNGIYTDFYEAADIANAARENLRRLAASEGQP